MSSGKEVMKKLLKILPCFLMPLLVLGCATTPSENSVTSNKGTSAEAQPSSNPVSSNAPTSSAHEHVWSEDYASDGTTHWKYCTVAGCNAKSEITAHTLGESAFYLILSQILRKPKNVVFVNMLCQMEQICYQN